VSYNLPKNRYDDCLPFDETRVVLPVIDGVEGSDYINADWISDMQGNKKTYICAQGPMDNTVIDFWRMIVEYDITVIVMLTRLKEESEGKLRDKCAQYWPETGSATYGGVEVTLIKEEKGESIVIRELKVKKQDSKILDITHIQFTTWSDNGVPPSEDYIILSDKTDEYLNKANSPSPLLIHCTAGVGRSGVFIAVRNYIRFLRDYINKNKNFPSLSVAKVIVDLRTERPDMVQNGEQYEFVYKAIMKEIENLEKQYGVIVTPPTNNNNSNENKNNNNSTDLKD